MHVKSYYKCSKCDRKLKIIAPKVTVKHLNGRIKGYIGECCFNGLSDYSKGNWINYFRDDKYSKKIRKIA